MALKGTRVFMIAGIVLLAMVICAGTKVESNRPEKDAVSSAVTKGVKWLASVQGKDGGWGQDGGETSYVRQGENLESQGNDVANTAVAAEALLHAGSTPTSGPNRESLQRAVLFILRHVSRSPVEGLAVTDLMGTQIQRKLGPYIDTFLTTKLLAELDGNMGDKQTNALVRQSLQKCVAKIEKNQLKDGSWNVAGGWAPILGTSLASQSLFAAQQKGVPVEMMAMARVDSYTKMTAAPGAGAVGAGSGRGYGPAASPGAAAGSVPAVGSFSPGVGGVGIGEGGGVGGGRYAVGSAGVATGPAAAEVSAVSAGVSLYKRAQELEQLSRTDADRKKNAAQIKGIEAQLSDPRFVAGFGSIGGEEFFSYLNISDSLHRAGGPEWRKWNSEMTAKLIKMQNEDGTWAGHHCITGRVAVTSAAILMLVADREQVLIQSAKKN